MGLGLAKRIGVNQFSGEIIDSDINKWLENNPKIEVIDIKFSASAQQDEWGVDALVIYLKD